MKSKKIYSIASVLVIAGMVLFFSCKKDKTDTSAITGNQLNEAQQSESEDAMADKVEQDLDNNLDNLESNGYSASSKKSAIEQCVGIDIDSTTHAGGWPRNITFTYDCQDTINGEVISQLGAINVNVARGNLTAGGYLYTRTVTFTDYTVTIDSVSTFNLSTSPSIKITGTRTVARTSIVPTISADKKLLRVVFSDAITSDMSFRINYGDTAVTFTRNVNRTRTANMHYRRTLITKKWISEIADDSVSLSGPVTGVNARGYTYTRNISTPLLFTFCPVWPHNLIISEGQIDLSNSNGAVGTITYTATGCKTIVTLTRNGKTKIISRRFGRKFHRWW